MQTIGLLPAARFRNGLEKRETKRYPVRNETRRIPFSDFVFAKGKMRGRGDDVETGSKGYRRERSRGMARYEVISKIRETLCEVYSSSAYSRSGIERNSCFLIRRDRIVGPGNLSRVFFTRNVPPPCETRYTGFFPFFHLSVSSFPSFPTNRGAIKRDRYPSPPLRVYTFFHPRVIIVPSSKMV